jgi:hypothetical protein
MATKTFLLISPNNRNPLKIIFRKGESKDRGRFHNPACGVMGAMCPNFFFSGKLFELQFFATILSEAKRPQGQMFEREARVFAPAVEQALEWSKEDSEMLHNLFIVYFHYLHSTCIRGQLPNSPTFQILCIIALSAFS